MISGRILQGDIRAVAERLESESVHCIVTSPPYWGLRDYGVGEQIGLETTPEEYVDNLVTVFHELKRVLREDGTVWLNLGDSYSGSGKGCNGDGSPADKRGAKQGTNAGTTVGHFPKVATGLKPKDLVGIPWRVAFALQADGWWLRQDIIWAKTNPMPESVKDRCTRSHEHIFLLAKSQRYYYNQEAIKEPSADISMSRYKYSFSGRPAGATICPGDDEGQRCAPKGKREFHDRRNKRDVWIVSTKSYEDAHFATFPTDLIRPCILAGCPQGGTVLDPFLGSGTTAVVAIETGRQWVGVELNPTYIEIARRRIARRPRTGLTGLGMTDE